MLTLLDLAKLTGSDKSVGLIEAVTTVAPEVDRLPARTISGLSYKTSLRTAYPGGSFRAFNAGVTPTKSTFEQKVVECYPYQLRVVVDKQLADGHEDGAAGLQAIESVGAMEGGKIDIGAQIIYGTGADASGFPGLAQGVDLASMGVDATGSTAGGATSLWAVKLGEQHVNLVFGGGGVLDLSDFRVETAYDSNDAGFVAYVAEITANVGLQIVNPNSIGRIYNLTAQTGKGLTDALIADLIAKNGWKGMPDLFITSRVGNRMLQRSRTVVIQTSGSNKATGGVENTAPWPTEAFGIPILVSDSVRANEAII